MYEELLKHQINKDIIALLAASKIPALEKRIWVNMLPHLTEKEKEELRANLTREIEYEVKVEKEVIDEFLKNMEQKLA